jgi:hypothetical protein
MQSILVFWRIILQMKFTISCDGMLIVHYIGTEVLLEPAVTARDKKNLHSSSFNDEVPHSSDTLVQSNKVYTITS